MARYGVYVFNDVEVRVVGLEGEPWFVARDVAKALEYRGISDFGYMVPKNERCYHKAADAKNIYGAQVVDICTLFSMLDRSSKPLVKRFRAWVNNDVLPAFYRNVGKSCSVENSLSEDKPGATKHTVNIRVSEMARMVQQCGVAGSPRHVFDWLLDEGYLFFDWLLDKGYLFFDSAVGGYAPTSKSERLGLFVVEEIKTMTYFDESKIHRFLRVTARGRDYFSELWCRDGGEFSPKPF